MTFDINLKAPVIIIPRSSTSRHVLVVDLGRLTVSNSFKAVVIGESTKTSEDLPPVIDYMLVDLTDMKLFTYVPLLSLTSVIELFLKKFFMHY